MLSSDNLELQRDREFTAEADTASARSPPKSAPKRLSALESCGEEACGRGNTLFPTLEYYNVFVVRHMPQTHYYAPIFALLLLLEKVSTSASQTRTEKAGKFQFKQPNKASSKEGIPLATGFGPTVHCTYHSVQ